MKKNDEKTEKELTTTLFTRIYVNEPDERKEILWKSAATGPNWMSVIFFWYQEMDQMAGRAV